MKKPIAATLVLSLMLAASAALAADMGMDNKTMPETMKKDGMPADGMKKDAMGHDGMKKPETMKKDGMTKDGMKKEPMGHDTMDKPGTGEMMKK